MSSFQEELRSLASQNGKVVEVPPESLGFELHPRRAIGLVQEDPGCDDTVAQLDGSGIKNHQIDAVKRNPEELGQSVSQFMPLVKGRFLSKKHSKVVVAKWALTAFGLGLGAKKISQLHAELVGNLGEEAIPFYLFPDVPACICADSHEKSPLRV